MLTNERAEAPVSSYSNDMNRRALDRRDLCVSFEPYNNFVNGVVFSLSLKIYRLFFL